MMTLLAEAAVRSLMLGAAVWVALLVFRLRNPHLQKTIWLTVLLASLAMPLVLRWQLTPRFDVPEYLLEISQLDSGQTARATGDGASPLLSLPDARAVSWIYGAGVLVLLARLALGLVSMWRIRRGAHPHETVAQAALAGAAAVPGVSLIRDDIRLSEKILSPATFGSTILLPRSATTWSEAKLAAVLSHERAHVRHRDCYVQWLARLHTSLFWFNPLAWWLQRHLAELAETTSDDAAVETLRDRTAYAGLLLEIARNPPAGRVAMSAARPSLSNRIERIISNIPPASPLRRWTRVLVVALLIPPITLAASTFKPVAALPVHLAQADVVNDPQWQDLQPNPPKILNWGDMGDLEQFYPLTAKMAGREGEAVVGVIVNPKGYVIGTTLLSVSPDDPMWGFGVAAETTARTVIFDNNTGATLKFKLKVKFALAHGATPDIKVPTPDPSWTTTHSQD